MSIGMMKEGEIIGRGVKDPKLDARLRARLKSVETPETVAILGAGPSGLLAAHAVELTGKTAAIFSSSDGGPMPRPKRSEIGAATYLHAAIPDLTSAEPDDMIKFIKLGTGSGYALKVYGDRLHPSSWALFEEGSYPAWSLQAVYDELWDRFSDRIVPMDVGPEEADEFLDDFGMVISSIPAPTLCDGSHSFPSRTIWVTDEAISDCHHQGDPVIVYDGRAGALGDRYRSSLIFGKASTEYAREVPGSRQGIKVLPSQCDCRPEIVRVGRWGEWKPGVLTHHAFEKTWGLMFDAFEGS